MAGSGSDCMHGASNQASLRQHHRTTRAVAAATLHKYIHTKAAAQPICLSARVGKAWGFRVCYPQPKPPFTSEKALLCSLQSTSHLALWSPYFISYKMMLWHGAMVAMASVLFPLQVLSRSAFLFHYTTLSCHEVGSTMGRLRGAWKCTCRKELSRETLSR